MNLKMIRYRILAVPAAMLLSLSACGGGGGGDGSAAGNGGSGAPAVTLAPISQSNYQTVAAVVVDPVGALADLNSTTGSLITGVQLDEPQLSLAGVSTRIYEKFRAKTPNLVTGAVFTEACSGGGSVTINESVASESRYTAGDRIAITANNCEEADMPVLNGAAALTITSVSGDPINTTTYSVGIGATFDNFALSEGAERVLIKGDLNVNASQSGSSVVNIAISGQALAFTLTNAGVSNSYLLAAYEFAGSEGNGVTTLAGKYTVSGTSAKLGGNYSYRVETVQPLSISGSADVPSTGALIVLGSPASVTVTALNTSSVRIDYSDKGDGTVSATNTLSWSAFEALK